MGRRRRETSWDVLVKGHGAGHGTSRKVMDVVARVMGCRDTCDGTYHGMS